MRADPARLGLIGAAVAATTIFAVAVTVPDDGPSATAAQEQQPKPETGSGQEPDQSEQPEEPQGPEPGDEIEPATFAATIGLATMSARTADLTATVEVAGQEVDVDAQVDFSESRTQTRLSVPIPGGEADVLIDGDVLYAKLDHLTAGRYLRLDLDDAPAPLDELPTDGAHLVAALGVVVIGADQVVYDGPDEIDGQSLERYTVTTRSDRLREWRDQPGLGGLPEDLVADVWVAPDNTISRLTLDLGDAGEVRAVAHAWGEPVDVGIPDDDQLLALPEFSLPKLSVPGLSIP